LDSNQQQQRACSPISSHGNLVGQRNDRLGRIRRCQRCEHRRQILRGCTEPNTHAYINGDTYTYGNGDFNADRNAYIQLDANWNADGNSDGYGNAAVYPDAEAASDACAASLA
jgi:hypothetical protein